ncbi:MAG: hypothetical protein ACPHCN_18095 [Mycobacterium sp.]
MAGDGDATFEIKLEGLQGSPAAGGAPGDDAALADFYAKAKAAWDKRNSQRPKTAKDKPPLTEGRDPEAWLESKLKDIQRRRARALGIMDPVGSGKSMLKSSIASAAKKRGAVGMLARRAMIARAGLGAAAGVAYVGAQAVATAGAIGNTLASAIPGLGGMPSHKGYDVGGIAQHGLATVAATASSAAETAAHLKNLTMLGLLDDAAARKDDVGIRIAAKNVAKARIATQMAAIDKQRFTDGMLEAGTDGAIYAAQQMFDASGAPTAASMAAFKKTLIAVITDAPGEIKRLLWGN